MNQSFSSLSDEDLALVLRRAHEIESSGQGGIEDYIAAAEEAGISREATMLALKERLGQPMAPPDSGQMVFAKSADGHFYVATVSGTEGALISVRFVNGSDAKVPVADIRDFSVTPGKKLSIHSSGMWFDGEVIRFNPESRSVTMNLWGSEETVNLEKVRLRKPNALELDKNLNLWTNRIGWFVMGSGVGALILWLLTRK